MEGKHSGGDRFGTTGQTKFWNQYRFSFDSIWTE